MNIEFSERLLNSLLLARHVVAFTGAGVSAESGVPTFRGNEGIWSKFKPEELATMNAFLKNPSLVWEWYAARKKIIGSTQPNEGHVALAGMEKMFPSFAIITQNIDDLHRRAGNTTVYELHGNIRRNYCLRCGMSYTDDDILLLEMPPRCTRTGCAGMVRPDVVWFGELLPQDQWDDAERASAQADVFLSIGTSGVVYPAAMLPMLAKRNGAFLIEINPDQAAGSGIADEFLQGPSGVILPLLYDVLKSAWSTKSIHSTS